MKPVVAIDVRRLASVCGGGDSPAMEYRFATPDHLNINEMAPGDYVLNGSEPPASQRSGSSFEGRMSLGVRPGLATCPYGVDWVARAQTRLGQVTVTRCNDAPK
jgi:hypothetical protein